MNFIKRWFKPDCDIEEAYAKLPPEKPLDDYSLYICDPTIEYYFDAKDCRDEERYERANFYVIGPSHDTKDERLDGMTISEFSIFDAAKKVWRIPDDCDLPIKTPLNEIRLFSFSANSVEIASETIYSAICIKSGAPLYARFRISCWIGFRYVYLRWNGKPILDWIDEEDYKRQLNENIQLSLESIP